jgi:hypothetical protein
MLNFSNWLKEKKLPHLSPKQPIPDFDLKNKNRKEQERLVGDAYKKAIKIIDNIKKSFEIIIKKNSPSSAKIMIGVKKKEAFIDKVLNRDKNIREVHDILRAAILCNTDEEVDDVVKKLKRNVKIHEYEFKRFELGSDFGYYGSHHFDIVINDFIIEIQVMTKKLWKFKEFAHQIYKKYRSMGDLQKDINQELQKDKNRSKLMFAFGNAPEQKKSKRAKYKRDKSWIKQMYEKTISYYFDSKDTLIFELSYFIETNLLLETL